MSHAAAHASQSASRNAESTHLVSKKQNAQTRRATHGLQQAGTTCTAQHKSVSIDTVSLCVKHTNTIPINCTRTEQPRANPKASLHAYFQSFVSCRVLEMTESPLRKHSQQTTNCRNKFVLRNGRPLQTLMTNNTCKRIKRSHFRFTCFLQPTPLHIYSETSFLRIRLSHGLFPTHFFRKPGNIEFPIQKWRLQNCM